MIPCFITARLNSERLPGKHLLPLGNTTVADHVVKRCEHFGFQSYLCVPLGEYDAFNEATSCLDIFEGDPDDVETRVMECATKNNIRVFHELGGDDPFFDEWAVIDSFNAASDGNISRVYPSYQSQAGSGRVGTSYNLTPTAKPSRNLSDRLESHPWPQRLTLDYEEDYHLILAVNRMVGGYMAPRRVVDELFVKNPDLHKINWFRNEEWKEHQRREKR